MVLMLDFSIAQWRQMYFRPNKPLPKDVSVGPNEVPVQRRPARRALFDFLVSCLCLGIPYIFLERARLSARGDPESGMFRQNSMVIIGACTCLVVSLLLPHPPFPPIVRRAVIYL
jgi:hypothetical protein